MRVVADENMPGVEALLGGEVELLKMPGREIQRKHLLAADALLVRSVTPVGADLLRGTPVKFVGTATAGTDHIDIAWLRGEGIKFASAPGANANSVVEYVLSAVATVDDFLERLLSGGVLGIVGYGRVGRMLAERLHKLGIAHRVYDPWLEQSAICHSSPLQDVLQCDVVCLHPELTHRLPWPSHHLLDQERLSTIGKAQLLINASRGAVIDNAALLRRLRSPGAPAVVLDVWESEPAINAELLSRVRVGTAHIAGYSLNSKLLASQMVCDALAREFSMPLQETVISPKSMSIVLHDSTGAAAALRQLLSTCYAVSIDDDLLRQATIGVERSLAVQNFDALRKQYAVRWELAGRSVMLPAGADMYRSLLDALGCTAQTVESS